MSATMLAKGLLSWIPGVQRTLYDRDAAHGTGSPAYCYGVWIKHLTLLWASGMPAIPRTVLEFGPGESIGTGVAALLSGAERYIAVDTVAHMRPEANLAIFHELVRLFRERAPRPRAGFPPIDEYLDQRLFPSRALDEETLERSLEPNRLARIELAVRSLGTSRPDPMLRYFTWDDPQPVEDGSLDLVFSHVVLNHVTDLSALYGQCARWLKAGAWMSHHIDFTCLGTAREWNGHRAYSDFAWSIVKGNRPYFVNREPAQTHLDILDRVGFDVVRFMRGRREGGITRAQLAPRYRGISDDDLATRSGFMMSRRRPF
jgi:SAM-dependent methyltransferase